MIPRVSIQQPITLFYSYAHEDEPLRQQLETHLSLLQRQGLILPWHDRELLAGSEWGKEIDEHLNTASIILLLISPDFLASDYCYAIEMQRALERHKCGEARVIPILVRPCDWQRAPFGKLQCAPRDGKAITTWVNQDEAFLAVAKELRRVIEQFTGPKLAPFDERNRTILLKRVRKIWIEGLLEKSLHQAAWIDLALQEQPDALMNPWQLQVQELNQAPSPLPVGTSLVQVYDEADGELLLLGEPGAGKTTLLLELARTLLERAEQDIHHTLPVIFNLSSWADKRLPLSDWMREELWTKYQVSPKIGATFLATDQILPLLDGLDEVTEGARAACVQAINTYSQDHLQKGQAPFVVCCRSKDYTDLPLLLTMQRAVSILPLTNAQIEQYLQHAQGQLEALQHALKSDAELHALAHQPLMLSIFTLAYQRAIPADLPDEPTRESTLRAVFASYVERMLIRRGQMKRWKSEQVRHFLTFLAGQMRRQGITIFSVEGLQPDWLPAKRKRLYRWSTVLVCGLLGGLLGGLLVGLAFGLVGGLVGGLVFGLVGGLVFGLDAKIEPAETLVWSWRGTRSGLAFGLLGGLIGGLAFGLLSGLSGRQLTDRISLSPNEGIWRSGRSGLLVGLAFVLAFGLLGGLVCGLLVGLLGGLLIGLVFGLAFGLLFGLVFGLLVGLAFGLDAFVQHFMLRVFLWHLGSLPWNLVPFLDEAAKRLLLRKVGGSYIFVHRRLLDYFASLEHIDE